MKIERVKILEIDDSLKLLQPTRAIEIKTNKGITITPNRCATSYEFYRKAELPTEITVDNPVSIYNKKLTGKEVENLLTTNEEYGKQLKSIEKVDRITEYSTLHASTFQLAESSSTGNSPMETLKEGENLDKFLRFLIDMQNEAMHDIVSIPALNLPLNTLKKELKNANDAIRKLNKQPLFSIDLKYDKFKEILDYVESEFQTNFINLIYRKKRDYPQHYDHLRNFARKDIAFIMTDVNRIDFDHEGLSTMHYMPFLGNDLFAVETPGLAIPKKNTVPKPKNITNLKILKEDELTIKSIIDNDVSSKKILDQIGNPLANDLDLNLSNIEEAKTDNKKYKILNALTKIQELKVSSEEFTKLTIHVRERSSKDYVKSKINLEQRISKI